MGEVEAKLLVNKMTKRIKVIRVKTLGQELTVIYTKGMFDTLALRLVHLETETLWLDSN